MSDYLIRALAKEVGVRALVCVTTELAQEAARRHETSPTASATLGRALTGAALIGALLKVQQRVAIKFEGTGAAQKVLTESDSYGRIRGYIGVPDFDLPLANGRPDIVGALGRAGLLTVVKDVRLQELVESVVPLETSDIAGDLANYLNQSEQTPSLVELGALLDESGRIHTAGGLLIQTLPPHETNSLDIVAERIEELPPVVDLLRSGNQPEDILELLFADMTYISLEHRELHFQCQCSWERGRQALVSLGAEELQHILENEGEAVVDCHFCHERYVYNAQELEELIHKLTTG